MKIDMVVPHAGTWIEIMQILMMWMLQKSSFPTRERGLKSIMSTPVRYAPARRSPRGNVD